MQKEEPEQMNLNVSLKSIGTRKQSVTPVSYPIEGCPTTVRELILAVTKAGVLAYNENVETKELLSYLTKEEIAEQSMAGKVSFGVCYNEKKADLAQAQENALQCFTDGIYRIFMDNQPLKTLDAEITIAKDTVFTFVRLTMLAGRMW